MADSPETLAQAIAFAQIFMLVMTLPFSMSHRARTLLKIAVGVSAAMAIASVALFVSSLLGLAGVATVAAGGIVTWTLITVGVFVLQVATLSFRGLRMRVEDARLETPAVRSRAGEELRTILRREGMELDERLEGAREEREQFLYALEERHAAQIASLAEEYQAEAHTILTQLLDRLAAEQLQPMVEQRLAEHRDEIADELTVLEQVASGDTLDTLRERLDELNSAINAAEERVATIRDDNPESTVEERVNARVDEIVASLDSRRDEIDRVFAERLDQARDAMEHKIGGLADLVDGKVDLAGNPLVARMEAAEDRVEARMRGYLETLEKRFAETEQLLTDRTVEQERALEERVLSMEARIDNRLEEHAGAIETVLDQHDTQLQDAVNAQSTAIDEHVQAERTRLIDDLGEQVAVLREQIRTELTGAEDEARESISATHEAWDSFTGELEARFQETRRQALEEARQIAEAERQQLQASMEQITGDARGHLGEQLEQVGREAAWQRAQVERTIAENLDLLQRTAQDAMDNADTIFADLERMGADRVDTIRVRAEESLVSSRDYVEQLEQSLAEHLEAMQVSVSGMADDLDTRLTAITTTAKEAGGQLEEYGHTLIDSVTAELTRVSEERIDYLNSTLTNDLQQRMQAAVEQQHRLYEEHLRELAQQVTQQVNGDLAGLVEHARGAVSTELEGAIAQAREQAQQLQAQGHSDVMQEIARQQQELATTANEAASNMRGMIDGAMRDSRRQLDEALASMGAHLREELVRFQDEGRRRTDESIERLRSEEQDLLREEDRKLGAARDELVRRHQATIQQDLANALSGGSSAPAGSGLAGGLVDRPATPLGGNGVASNPFNQ